MFWFSDLFVKKNTFIKVIVTNVTTQPTIKIYQQTKIVPIVLFYTYLL